MIDVLEEEWSEKILEDIKVDVYNVTGQRIYSRRYEGCLPYMTYAVGTEDMARGIYFVRFAYSSGFEIKKIIVE